MFIGLLELKYKVLVFVGSFKHIIFEYIVKSYWSDSYVRTNYLLSGVYTPDKLKENRSVQSALSGPGFPPWTISTLFGGRTSVMENHCPGFSMTIVSLTNNNLQHMIYENISLQEA